MLEALARSGGLIFSPHLSTYIGFAEFLTLKGCHFEPMGTNRAVSPEVVAARVARNAAALRARGFYHDFATIFLIAVQVALPPPLPFPLPLALLYARCSEGLGSIQRVCVFRRCRSTRVCPCRLACMAFWSLLSNAHVSLCVHGSLLIVIQGVSSSLQGDDTEVVDGQAVPKFFISDGQHRLETMRELAALAAAPIHFQLRCKVCATFAEAMEELCIVQVPPEMECRLPN